MSHQKSPRLSLITRRFTPLRTPAGQTAVPFEVLGAPPSAETLSQWFSALAALQRQVAGTPDFFATTAHALVAPGGLDGGVVLQRGPGPHTWRVRAAYPESAGRDAARLIAFADISARHTQTCYQVVGDAGEAGSAAANSDTAYVSAPLLDGKGQVWGVVCGLRHTDTVNRRRGVRLLEALWVQLLAELVSGGLARQAAEQRAVRTRVLFQQMFSPAVVEAFERDPSILAGHEQPVSVLFCDLREFSRFSAQLPPRMTYTLLSDVLDALTECVIQEDGVIVDYYGDGLEAMWNAPLPQADHAVRACRAACHMQQRMEQLSRRWQPYIASRLRLGCGVHTGIALVGNAGSQQRVKYGPRGTTVNLASRIESATKPLRARILVSHATRRLLPADWRLYALPAVRLAGYVQPMRLLELGAMTDPLETPAVSSVPCCDPRRWDREYARALRAFETADFVVARRILERLLPVANGPVESVRATFLMEQVALHAASRPRRRKTDRPAAEFDAVLPLDPCDTPWMR